MKPVRMLAAFTFNRGRLLHGCCWRWLKRCHFGQLCVVQLPFCRIEQHCMPCLCGMHRKGGVHEIHPTGHSIQGFQG